LRSGILQIKRKAEPRLTIHAVL